MSAPIERASLRRLRALFATPRALRRRGRERCGRPVGSSRDRSRSRASTCADALDDLAGRVGTRRRVPPVDAARADGDARAEASATDATREDGASAEDARCEGARERARGRGGRRAREATRRGRMKRARDDARSSAEGRGRARGGRRRRRDAGDAAARADSLSRRSSTWLDAGGDVENAPGETDGD